MRLTCPMCKEDATVLLTWVEDDQVRVYCEAHAKYKQATSLREIKREPYDPT